MSREFDHLTDADMKALALARTWGIPIDHGSNLASPEAPDVHLPRNSAGPLREVSKRQVRDRDGKIWKAKDAGQLFAPYSFIDQKPE